MKKEVAIKWVKALRSGRYKQTQKVIEDKSGYCCLGVLCKISRKKYDPTENNGYCPMNIVDWAGLKSSRGYNDIGVSLVEMNDEKGMSFKEIADFIEKHWEKL